MPSNQLMRRRDKPVARVRPFVPAVAMILMLTPACLAQLPAASDEPITPIPQAGALDARRAALGAALFNDQLLSGNGKQKCASCHDLKTNGASRAGNDAGPDGKMLPVNTNTVFNASLSFRYNWSGNARTLEDQASMSLLRTDVMAITREQAVDRIRKEPGMVPLFRAAYGRDPDWDSLIGSIATFERTLVTPGGRFDLWLGGDSRALDQRELVGYHLFKSIGCISCHQGVNIGGNLFERHGVVTPGKSSDNQIFRVPSLRNVAVTPPYFHDGRAATLDVAVREMASAQLGRELTSSETLSIVAFLGTLTGRYQGQTLRAAQ